MPAVLEPILALCGMIGITIFGIGSLLTRIRTGSWNTSQISHTALLLGLLVWTGMFLLRHDVVTVVGLLLAMALLHRRHRALLSQKTVKRTLGTANAPRG